MFQLILLLVLPLFCEAIQVLDVTTMVTPTLPNEPDIKIQTLETEKALWKCVELDKNKVGSYHCSEIAPAPVAFGFIYMGGQLQAQLCLDTCQDFEKLKLNVLPPYELEVQLTNGKWAYYERNEIKGKDFVRGTFPETVWRGTGSK